MLKSGGKVLGKVRHPFPGTDFSSFLLQAKASGAKISGSRTRAATQSTPSSRPPSSASCRRSEARRLLIFITDTHVQRALGTRGRSSNGTDFSCLKRERLFSYLSTRPDKV